MFNCYTLISSSFLNICLALDPKALSLVNFYYICLALDPNTLGLVNFYWMT